MSVVPVGLVSAVLMEPEVVSEVVSGILAAVNKLHPTRVIDRAQPKRRMGARTIYLNETS
jgi:hypothetical protein